MGHEAMVGLLRVLRDDGGLEDDYELTLPDDELLRMYREMRRVRLLETRLVAAQRQGRVGFYGACTGQEAVPVATACATRPTDWIFPALRESAIMLVRGFPLATFLAQVYGSSQDLLKGRQMPAHMSARQVNHVSWSSCIGSQIPHAVGAAWAAKIRGDETVCIGFLGDGATSSGDFHNGMNFAGVYRVPCVVICQNNQWSISTPVSRQTASETLAVKAAAYGVAGVRVDGNDVLAVHRVVSQAVERARAGSGPTFVECLTYRMAAHSTSDDPTKYRSEEEVREWGAKDPIARFRRFLVARRLLDDAEDARLESEVAREIAQAIDEVERHRAPDVESLFDDVYEKPTWNLEEQRRELLGVSRASRG